MAETKREDNSFLAGIVLGGVIGAALALVLGKEEGEKIKQLLIEKGKTIFANLEQEKGEIKQSLPPPTNSETKSESSLTAVARRFFKRDGKKLI
jgi:gas vesicle protein